MTSPHRSAQTPADAADWALAATARIDSLFAHVERAMQYLRSTDAELARFAHYQR